MPSLGCDYSAAEAYLSVSDGERVLHAAKIKLQGDLAEQRRDYLNNLCRIMNSLKEEFKIDTLWLEEPWIAGSHFPQAGLKLARNAAYIEVSALGIGLDVIRVHVMTWRKGIFNTGKPQDPKKTAVAWVLYNLGHETKNHNEAEAALIATYGERQTVGVK